jgi:hypothetical protein
MFSKNHLLENFVSPQMRIYYSKKCPSLSQNEIETQLCEMLKFLILVEHFPGNIIFGKEIDDMWHLWIMQTVQYAELCQKLPGNFFRHHSSKDYPEEIFPENMSTNQSEQSFTSSGAETPQEAFLRKAQRILSFFATYYANFGPIEANVVGYWPPLQRMIERLGWSVNDLNGFLSQQVQTTQPAHETAIAQ